MFWENLTKYVFDKKLQNPSKKLKFRLKVKSLCILYKEKERKNRYNFKFMEENNNIDRKSGREGAV